MTKKSHLVYTAKRIENKHENTQSNKLMRVKRVELIMSEEVCYSCMIEYYQPQKRMGLYDVLVEL